MVAKLLVITRIMITAVLCFAFAACSMGMDDALGRTTKDPFAEIPTARSFNGDYSVALHWTRDEASDEYFLYRAVDSLNPRYELLYQGLLTEYRDTFELTAADKPFLYRLGKKRGNKLFVDFNSPGKASLGIVSGSTQDIHEPNNSKESATCLKDTTLEVNSWFYSSNTIDDISVYDEDWYYVDIPPHWEATLILIDHDVGDSPTVEHFKIEKWGVGIDPVRSNTPFTIANTSNYPDRFYFRIFPNHETFRRLHFEPDPPEGSGSGGCGKFIRYNIKVSILSPN